jgi:lambda family phage minor tail protein L
MADNKVTTSDARENLKQITKEVTSLEASSIISLYKIDVSEIKLNRNLGESDIIPDMLRFHNEESISQRVIKFKGEDYHPLPIITDGFQVNSDGSMPRPTITFASVRGIEDEVQKDTVAYYFRSLKRAILQLDNMMGAKVIRVRTFYKFLDAANNLAGVGDFVKGVDKNPEFPRETYYVQRKVSEDKHGIKLELSSVLDMQNFKLPSRLVMASRCPWQYRGAGCCYEFKAAGVVDEHESTEHLPDFAPPIANEEDELISKDVTGYDPLTVTSSNVLAYDIEKTGGYAVEDVVYITKNDIRYYYVAKKIVPEGAYPPPHTDYWEPDRCSKTLAGCKLRWGSGGSALKIKGASNVKARLFLPFGGFPGTNSKTIIQ